MPMQPVPMTPTLTLCSACEKAGSGDEALSLFSKMQEDGVQPDVYNYSGAIQACAAAQQPDEALRLFKEALRSVEPSYVTFNAVLDAVASPQPAIARELWLQGCERGLYREVEKWEAGAPKLDLHDHSEGAGETALRWWLEERVPALRPKPNRLIIVTGFGKSRRAKCRRRCLVACKLMEPFLDNIRAA